MLPLFPFSTYASIVAAKMRIQRCLLQLPMKFSNIIRVETSRYLTKIMTLRRSRRFLQPSIRLRYNYYVQLVATKARLDAGTEFEPSPKGGVEAGRAHHCTNRHRIYFICTVFIKTSRLYLKAGSNS